MNNRKRWKKVPIDVKVKYIGVGASHILFLSENNIVYACGANSDGQLGVGD